MGCTLTGHWKEDESRRSHKVFGVEFVVDEDFTEGTHGVRVEGTFVVYKITVEDPTGFRSRHTFNDHGSCPRPLFVREPISTYFNYY